MFYRNLASSIVIASCVIGAFCESYFPPDVKICSARDPNLNECIKESANRMIKHLAPGIAHLNAVSMDPLLVNEMILPKGNNLLPNFSFYVKDVRFFGWKDGYFSRVEFDPKTGTALMQFTFPFLRQTGLYEIDSSLASIPLRGNSDFEVFYKNMTADLNMKARLQMRNGRHYLVLDKFNRKFHVEDIVFNFRNLFDDEKISKATNEKLNSNGRAILKEVQPLFDAILGDIARTLMQRILDVVPYDALLKDVDYQFSYSPHQQNLQWAYIP